MPWCGCARSKMVPGVGHTRSASHDLYASTENEDYHPDTRVTALCRLDTQTYTDCRAIMAKSQAFVSGLQSALD